MNSSKLFGLLGAGLLSACISLPDVEPAPPPDAGIPDAVSLRLITPNEPTFTNGRVAVTAELSGPTPDKVELLLDGALLAPLASPYTYTWDTASTAEGSHSLVAQATQGGKVYTSNTRTVIVDRTPPQWMSQSPLPGADKVSVQQPIEAVFSEALKRETLNAQTVRLKSGPSDIETSLSLSPDGRKLTGTPTSPLALDATLTLEVGADVTDAAGNPVPSPASAWTWRVPAYLPMTGVLNLGNPNSNTVLCKPDLQLEPAGKPVVAWLKWDPTCCGAKLHVQRWNGTSWEPTADPLSTSAAYFCSFELTGAARPIVALDPWDGTSRNVSIERWNGSSWENLGGAQSAYPGATDTFFPTIHMGKTGTPFVAWSESNGTTGGLHVRRWTGSTWEALGNPLNSNPSVNGVGYFSFELDAASNPVVFWEEGSSSSGSGTHAMRWNGTTWLPLSSTSLIAPSAQSPEVRLDPSGLPVVTWTIYDGTDYNAYVRRWNGSAWEPLGGALITPPGSQQGLGYSLRLDSAGRSTIALYEAGGSRIQRWNGSGWTSLGEASRALSESLQLDASGFPVTLWREQGAADEILYSVRGINR